MKISFFFFLIIVLGIISCTNQKNKNKDNVSNSSKNFNILSDESYISPIKIIGDINYLNTELTVKAFLRNSTTGPIYFIRKEGGYVIQSESNGGIYIVGIREIDNVYRGFFIKCHSSYTDYKTFQDSSLVFTNLSKENFYKVFPDFNGRYSYEGTDTLQIDLTFYDRLYQDSLLTLSLIENKK